MSGGDSATLLIDCAGSEVESWGSNFNVILSLSSSSSNRGLLHGAGCSDLIAVEVPGSHDASAVLVAILLLDKKDSVWVPLLLNLSFTSCVDPHEQVSVSVWVLVSRGVGINVCDVLACELVIDRRDGTDPAFKDNFETKPLL